VAPISRQLKQAAQSFTAALQQNPRSLAFPLKTCQKSMAGWWFGTFGLFFHMLGRIIPTD